MPGAVSAGTLVLFTLLGSSLQEALHETRGDDDRQLSLPRAIKWSEGFVVRVRVPVAVPGKELMTTLAFPEDGIETAITGWGEEGITATAKGGLLFLRLPKKEEGHINVIGRSGAHYLIHVEGVESGIPGKYDSYVKIEKAGHARTPRERLLRPRGRPRPVGSIELIQAMRLGLRLEGGRILRANREVAYRSPRIEIRLLYVYKIGSYIGRIYEIENLSDRRQPLDASLFRAKGETLILSGLRENVLPAKGKSRLYTAFWRD